MVETIDRGDLALYKLGRKYGGEARNYIKRFGYKANGLQKYIVLAKGVVSRDGFVASKVAMYAENTTTQTTITREKAKMSSNRLKARHSISTTFYGHRS